MTVIHNGDHAEFELEHANTPPKEWPDWPLPSFSGLDWAEAFCKETTGFTARRLMIANSAGTAGQNRL
jgi:hypothetical protein